MDIPQVLALYDHDERRESSIPGFQREASADVVRQLGPAGANSMVIFSQLTPESVDAAIAAEIAYFRQRGHGFEWKWYAHDQPPDLLERLARAGFAIGAEEAIMALDLAQMPVVLQQPTALDIRRITDPAQLHDVQTVQEQVWQHKVGSWIDNLARQVRANPEYISVYVAYVAAVPVCSAWINFPAHTPFASLWGGSTLAQYRGQGIYTAMVAVRAQEAVARGYRFLTIDASPMSRPIVAKHGFGLLSVSRPCDWQPATRA